MNRSSRTRNAPAIWLSGGGEMGERIRALDWSRTPLGPLERWPQSLRTAVSMLLPSKAQICLFWGAEFVTLYNDAYRPVFGAKHPRMLGQPGRVAWSEIWDAGPSLRGLLEGVVRTGEAFNAGDMLFYLERNGFAEETYFDVSYDPVRDETGAVGGVYCIVTETTGRVVGERRLALLRDLAARNSTARSAPQACKLAVETLAGAADVPYAAVYLDGELQAATAGPAPAQVKELALPGGRLVLGTNAQRLFDEQYAAFLELVTGQLATAIGNARAYEEEKKRSEALAELDRAKTAFFSNVSHEFRTPLTLMLGPLEDALADAAQPLSEEHRHRMEMMLRNGRRLQRLVNTLLDFSRIEAGRAQATYAATDLGRYTAALASNFGTACTRAGLQLDIDCPPLGQPVYVDAGMWEKIVLNLVSNAFKFTFDGRIEVSLRATDRAAELRVRDTGVGIAPAELPRLFERFYRIEGARARTHEGSGIGLAFVQELARMHGGEIDVASEPGKGSTFIVRLPFGSAHLPAERVLAESAQAVPAGASAFVEEAMSWLSEAAPPAAAALGAARPEAHILVADDNADMREYVAGLLRTRWRVTTATNGEEALALVAAQPFDLVLSDVMMPKLDGFGLLRKLKARPETADLPVVLLSARAGEDSRLDGMAAGADDYIVKPFTAVQLVAQIGAQLAISHTRRKAAEERERLRAEAVAANRAKDEFLAMLSHELRNPLAPISTAIQLMRLRGADVPELGTLERQTAHITRLVDDLMDVSRITRGKIELRRHAMEMGDVVIRAMEMATPLFEPRAHRVSIEAVPRRGLQVDADPERMAQVVFNLLSNAAKYSEPGSAITVRAWGESERVRLSVQDEGVGIAPGMIDRVFDMFVQQEQTIARSQGGLGLGLTIVKSLVELHGGRVSVRSAGVGKGSEFLVDLPAARKVLALPPAVAAGAAAQAPSSARRRVMVVDDNVDAAKALAAILRLSGHEVEVAHDGPDALTAARRFHPEVALIDIGLPVMDGYELAQRLRAESAPGAAPRMVAVTGYGLDRDRDLSAEAGFSEHLVKPIDYASLDRLLAQPGTS